MDTKPGAITLEDLIDELAKVLHESESARVLVLRAGFPAADLSAFDVPRVFWSRVIRAAADGKLVGGVQVLVEEVAKQYPGNGVFAGYRAQAMAAAQGQAPAGSGLSNFPPATTSSAQQATLGRTQTTGTPATASDGYDVFLSHSSADKAAVETVAARLRDDAGMRPFLDKWALVPGEPWMPALERAIERSTTVAVFFGPQGRGAWHDQESQLALVLAAEEQGKRVIPVLLPGARKEDVGGFMRLRTWVELEQGDGFERLVAGVMGRAPGSGVGALSGSTVPPTESAVSHREKALPYPWECGLLYERLNASLQRHRSARRDLELKVPGDPRPALPRSELLGFITSELARLTTWTQTVVPLINDHLPKALGADGEHGDRAEIEYLADTLGRVYGEVLRWGNGWRSMGLGDEWARVVEKFAGIAMSLASDIERFRDDLGRALDAARRHDRRSDVTYEISLDLRAPNVDGLIEEVARILRLDP